MIFKLKLLNDRKRFDGKWLCNIDKRDPEVYRMEYNYDNYYKLYKIDEDVVFINEYALNSVHTLLREHRGWEIRDEKPLL